MAGPVTAAIGLGSNLGDRAGNLRMALRLIAPLCRIEAVSSLYESDPVGVTDQPPFFNAACRAVTGLRPDALLRLFKNVEREIGRRPGAPPGGPRPIDLDLLFYGDHVVDQPGVTVPHPRLAERAFVLMPLAELDAGFRHPALGRTVMEMVESVDRDGVRLIRGPGWQND